MASIRPPKKTGPGTYQVLYRLDGRQTSRTFATPLDAQNFVNLIDTMGASAADVIIEARADGSVGEPTITELCREHVAALDDVTEGTRRDYERVIDSRIASQPLGHIPTSRLTVDHVREWLAYLERDGLAVKTRRNHHALLSAALTTAVRQQLRGTNPAKGLRIKADVADKGIAFLNPGELALLIGTIPAHYQPLVSFLAGTGTRWGEATALQVGDVDLESRVPVVYVRRAWKHYGSGQTPVVGPPKTRSGVRTVSLPAQLAPVLEPLIAGRAQDELVFTAPQGGRISHGSFHTRIWKVALDTLNATKNADGNPIMPRMTKRPRIHDLRHTHASQLIQAGVPLPVISKRLGHSSIMTTVNVYGHLAPDYLDVTAAAAAIGLAQALPEIEG